MTRFILRRLAIIPVVLLLTHFFGYAYAHLVLPIRASRIPYLAALPSSEPLLPAYAAYLQEALRSEFGTLPGGEEAIPTAISSAISASLGLLALALALSVLAGLLLGLRAVRLERRGVSRWLTLLSTVGLAMPSFYIGSLLIMAMFSYVLERSIGAPFPMQGFGWDRHLVLPTLALMARPTVQIAQVTAGLLEGELGKRYVLAARSVGHPWRMIRRRHALRNILAPVILTVAGSVRLLMGELILVEWLFKWPGLGMLFAQALVPGQSSAAQGSPLFLNPPVVATVLTAFAALFLVTDLIAAILVRVVDPRLRAPEEGTGSADVVSSHSGPMRRNWPLLLGSLIVLFVVVIAIAGPSLAPHDPLKEHKVIKVDDKWELAPFPAFTVPGFPLGSDSHGRDLLSRLLWAVRPTLIMVTIVASVRLALGTLIGLASSWFTGWAETAKIVREQTRLVKGRQYIEAARALGQVDRDSTIHVCEAGRSPECLAFTPGSEEPVWQVSLEKGERVQGGAMVPGRLYVTFVDKEGGFLCALENVEEGAPVVMVTAAANATLAAQELEEAGTPTVPPPMPTPSPTAVISAPVSTTPVPPTPAPPSTSPPAGQVRHVVQPGENLFRIALRYGTTIKAIASTNGIANPARIYAGQVLIIPSPGAQPPSPSTGGTTYVVQPGDNLFHIALRYNMSYLHLAQYNGIANPSCIYVGQVLRIPPH